MRNFYLPGRSCPDEILIQSAKYSDTVLANIVVHPVQASYDYYVVVEDAGVTRLKLWIYTAEMNETGQAHPSFKIRWKSDDAIVISIPSRQIEIAVLVKESKATTRDLSQHIIPPPYDMSRTRTARMLRRPAV